MNFRTGSPTGRPNYLHSLDCPGWTSARLLFWGLRKSLWRRTIPALPVLCTDNLIAVFCRFAMFWLGWPQSKPPSNIAMLYVVSRHAILSSILPPFSQSCAHWRDLIPTLRIIVNPSNDECSLTVVPRFRLLRWVRGHPDLSSLDFTFSICFHSWINSLIDIDQRGVVDSFGCMPASLRALFSWASFIATTCFVTQNSTLGYVLQTKGLCEQWWMESGWHMIWILNTEPHVPALCSSAPDVLNGRSLAEVPAELRHME
jgi:hypothetical protein